jgi:hypothetical protein
MKSFYSLVPFLSLFYNCQLSSIPMLRGSYPGRLASRNSTQFFSNKLFFKITLHGPRRKQPIYIWEGVFTAPLHSNGSYWSAACVFVAAGICSPSRYLAMHVYFDFTISAFGRHATIRWPDRFESVVMLPRNKRIPIQWCWFVYYGIVLTDTIRLPHIPGGAW